MRENTKNLWAIYHCQRKFQIIGLTFKEVSAVVQTIEPDEHHKWHVWREDWENWVALNEMTDAFPDIERPVPRTPPEHPGDFHRGLSAGPQGLADIFIHNNDPQEKPDSRKFERINSHLQVKLEAHGEVFNSECIDICPGGVRLSSHPSLFEGTIVNLTVVNSRCHEKIKLQAKILEVSQSGQDTRLAFLPFKEEGQIALLEEWIKKSEIPRATAS